MAELSGELRQEALELCQAARSDLSALAVIRDGSRDWMTALGKRNVADARCLEKAFRALTDAIEILSFEESKR